MTILEHGIDFLKIFISFLLANYFIEYIKSHFSKSSIYRINDINFTKEILGIFNQEELVIFLQAMSNGRMSRVDLSAFSKILYESKFNKYHNRKVEKAYRNYINDLELLKSDTIGKFFRNKNYIIDEYIIEEDDEKNYNRILNEIFHDSDMIQKSFNKYIELIRKIYPEVIRQMKEINKNQYEGSDQSK